MTASAFEQALARARESADAEAEFFRLLLDATLYAHAPLSDDHPRLRLLMLRHPDGYDAVPLFTDIEQAHAAAQGAARVLHGTGRTMLELTRGATVMLNPNREACLLFPEEITTLLESGFVARIAFEEVGSSLQALFRVADNPPPWVIRTLRRALAAMHGVFEAYVVEMRRMDPPDSPVVLLIVIGVPRSQADRTVRASATALQAQGRTHRSPNIDIMTFDAEAGPPEYLAEMGIKPFFRRAST